ncbi:MAG: tetratricopeptide repeat protein [Anaerolineaceae bacterium]|nr:tetratricopeptide repeat protein [Anaerolineaceae bacterium]
MKLFISYAPNDRARADELAALLNEAGHEAWVEHTLTPGQRWEKELKDQIYDCDALVFVVSRDALKSEWCKREYRTAKKAKMPISLILIDKNAESQIPSDLKSYSVTDCTVAIDADSTSSLVAELAKLAETAAAKSERKPAHLGQPTSAAEDESGFDEDTVQQVELKDGVSAELQTLAAQANELLTVGKWDKAIIKLNELVKQLPENAMIYAARGDAYSALQKFDEALADYDAVIRLEPENGKAYNIRANLYRDLERNDEALADFNESIRLDPEHAFPHVSRGMLFYHQGKIEEALKDFETYSALAPEDFLGHNNRAFVLFQMGRYEEAESAWKLATDNEDADDYVFAGHAVSLEQLKRPAEAVEQYRKAVQLNRRWKNKLDNVGAEYSWTEPMLVLATHIIGRLRSAR